MRAAAALGCLALATMVGCSASSSSTKADAGVYLNGDCEVAFSFGCPGSSYDGGTCQTPPFVCQPVDNACADNLTCECVGCAESTCACTGGGTSASCTYDAGTFVVVCNNI